jgi:hypothetical protein
VRKWILPCGIISCLLIALAFGGGLILLLRFEHFTQFLPTPQPTISLIAGNTYLISGISADIAPPLGSRFATLFNKPAPSNRDPSATVVGALHDATPVKLIGVQDDWCYVEGTDNGIHLEGWLRCNQLLDNRPTPIPTLNRTPQRPSQINNAFKTTRKF